MRRNGYRIHKLDGCWWVCKVDGYGKCHGRRAFLFGAEAVAAFAAGGR